MTGGSATIIEFASIVTSSRFFAPRGWAGEGEGRGHEEKEKPSVRDLFITAVYRAVTSRLFRDSALPRARPAGGEQAGGNRGGTEALSCIPLAIHAGPAGSGTRG